jgi:hypothetical protein
MENIAKRLRKKCLRKGPELEKGEAGDMDRLKPLVREIMQEGMVGVEENVLKTLREIIDLIVKQIRS